jgi:hypothetical protein
VGSGDGGCRRRGDLGCGKGISCVLMYLGSDRRASPTRYSQSDLGISKPFYKSGTSMQT